jgi:predicted transglutaminase-like cysteine proteinase
LFTSSERHFFKVIAVLSPLVEIKPMTLRKRAIRALTFAMFAFGGGLVATSACARPPVSEPMVVTQHDAPAPAGFAQFCMRLPQQCGYSEAPAISQPRRGAGLYSVSSASKPAGRYDWEATFSTVSQLRPDQRYDWSAAFGDTQPSVKDALPLTNQLWAQLEAVTRDINRRIAPRTDEEAFGVRDLWVMPLSEGLGTQGNCKHYVLEKRQALQKLGVPMSAMTIAVARTPWGDIHAVLVVATDKGDYVLDNLSPWVKPWRDTGYAWISRQRTDDQARFSQIAHLQ